VVVVREAAESARRQVVIGIGDLENSASLTFAFEEAALRNASLIAVHDVPVSQDLVHGHPGRALAGLSARADLVVLGRRSAHHGPASVMHAVLSHAHGPVVTVPS
jgi:hypothetical protein